MARYHLTPAGNPAVCSASVRRCPFGETTDHYPNKAAASAASESFFFKAHQEELKKTIKEKAKPDPKVKLVEARNQRGAYNKSLLQAIDLKSQLGLYTDINSDSIDKPEPEALRMKQDTTPITGDLLVQNGIIFKVLNYSAVRETVDAEPLVANHLNKFTSHYTSREVKLIDNYKIVNNELIPLSAEEIATRKLERNGAYIIGLTQRKQAEETIANAKLEAEAIFKDPELSLEKLEELERKHAKAFEEIDAETNYLHRIVSTKYIESAAVALDSESKLPLPHKAYVATLQSKKSKNKKLLDDEYRYIRNRLEDENYYDKAEVLKLTPVIKEEPDQPNFWKKMFNNKAEEQHEEKVEAYTNSKDRLSKLEEKIQRRTSLIASYDKLRETRWRIDSNKTKSGVYAGVAAQGIMHLYKSGKSFSINDSVAMKRMLESHIPEVLSIASKENLTKEEGSRLDGVLISMLENIENIKQNSGVISENENKRAIEFLELKFGDNQ